MKLTIEVEWDPMTAAAENPGEPMRHAHQMVRFAAEDLAARMDAFSGYATIAKLSVEG